jgi:hypothetical protein
MPHSIRPFLETSRRIGATITPLQGHCSAPPASTGTALSKFDSSLTYTTLNGLTPFISVRAKLASGEMAVTGDQWPMLVYANLQYDPDDPWSGLFRSQILIYVSAVSAVVGSYC